MNKTTSFRSLSARALLVSALLFAAGCNTLPTTGGGPVVEIPFDGDVARVELRIGGIGGAAGVSEGLAAVKAGDLAGARAGFAQAVAEKPANPNYHFALGVVCEALGDFEAAREHYEQANLHKGGEGFFDATAGLKRIKARALAAQ